MISMFPRVSHILITLMISLFSLSACSQVNVEEHFVNLPGSRELGENEEFTNQTNASLLIVGIRSNRPLQASTVSAIWEQFDPNAQQLVEQGANIEISLSASDQDSRDSQITKYYVLSIRPGFYILERATTSFRPTGFSVLDSDALLFPSSVINIKNQRYGHSFYERLYVPFGRGRVELNQGNLISQLLSSSLSHRFFVNPGDIVYIGNFVVGRNAPWVLKIDHDVEAVKNLLKEKYPRVKGRILLRHSILPTNISCNFKDKREKGLKDLRELVINSNVSQNSLSAIGCSSGTLPIARGEEIIVQDDDSVLEFGLPNLPQEQ